MDGVPQNACKYIEKDRLKEQFISSINNHDMVTQIIQELTTVKKINEITSEQVVSWAKRVESHRAQKAFMEFTKDYKVTL